MIQFFDDDVTEQSINYEFLEIITMNVIFIIDLIMVAIVVIVIILV